MALKKAEYGATGAKGSRGFEDLECYQLCLQLMVNCHDLARRLPTEERYDLADQLRRASKSSCANIAEGYGRHHWLDALRFYYIARGSLNESTSHLITARTLAYVEQSDFDLLYALARQAERALNGYIAYIQKRRDGHDIFGERLLHEQDVPYDVQ